MDVELRRSVLRRVWMRMAGQYGHRWTSAMGVSPEDDQGRLLVAGDEWMRAVKGLTNQQIADGLEAGRVSTDGWPPTANLFRLRCLGVPSIDVVRDEIKARQYSRFTRQVLVHLDWHGYHCPRDGKAAERVLQSAYQRACDHVMQGHALPDVPVALVEQQPRPFKPSNPAVAEAAFAAMARSLGVRSAVGGGAEP